SEGPLVAGELVRRVQRIGRLRCAQPGQNRRRHSTTQEQTQNDVQRRKPVAQRARDQHQPPTAPEVRSSAISKLPLGAQAVPPIERDCLLAATNNETCHSTPTGCLQPAGPPACELFFPRGWLFRTPKTTRLRRLASSTASV